MEDRTLEELTDEEFKTVIENFIEEEAEGMDEIEVSTFFRLWDGIEKKRAKPAIEVEGNRLVCNGGLRSNNPPTPLY